MAPLIIVSGPSGSGKSTLIREVLKQGRYPLRLAVSATTRSPRPGERDGVDYHFWTEERFRRAIEAGELLEHAIVHGRHSYGTPRSEVDGYRERGIGVLLDIDVQGAAQVRPLYPDHVSIFIRLPRWQTYEARIRDRGTESEATLARRLLTAQAELERQGEYQHLVENDELSRAVAQFSDLIGQAFATTATAPSPRPIE